MQRELTYRLQSSKILSTNGNPILQYIELSKRPIDAVSSVEHIKSVKKRSTIESILKEFASHLTYYKSYKSLSPRQKSRHEHKLAKEVLCEIVDNKELQEKSIDYLIENGEEIASISAYIVDMIKVYISK